LPTSLKPAPIVPREASGGTATMIERTAHVRAAGGNRGFFHFPSVFVARQSHRRLPERVPWPHWLIVAVRAVVVLALVGGWQAAASFKLIDPFFWSQPADILHTLRVFFLEGQAFTDIRYTFEATISGFVIGTLAGSLIGLSFWWSRNYAEVVQPFVICFESIPKLALAPLIILVFGIGLASKVAIAVALTVVVSTLTTYAGVQAVDADGERFFYSLGASRLQVFLKLVVPSVLPWTISILRVNIGLALTGAIVGEFISSQYGLGREILYAGQTYDIALVWVAVLVLSTFSIVMYAAVSWLEKLLRKGLDH
jgi:NitT/TauT family transport system permease protein